MEQRSIGPIHRPGPVTYTAYQKWIRGEYTMPGEFELCLFKCYMAAGSNNREKLGRAYPEYFKTKS